MPSLAFAGGQGAFVDDAVEAVLLGPDRDATIMLPSWNDKAWDWVGMADDSGYVDVIIAYGGSAVEGSQSLSLQGLLAKELGGSAQQLFDARDVVARHSFSLGVPGFSAMVRAGTIEQLLSAGPDLQIYPDLPVTVTLADSVVQIGADQMWARTDGLGRSVSGFGIVVAVIDTGIDYTHPDLGAGFGSGYKVAGGYDFYNNDADPMDDNGHGTHVAGIVAASGGVTGVAPDVALLAYKALGADGSGLMSDVIAAIDRALDPNDDGNTGDHADVISMSLGGEGEVGDPICLAVERAVAAGAVVVAAAGNDGPTMGSVSTPGLAPDAITVGAIDRDGALAEFSSRGTSPDLQIKPEISAPGVDIDSTVPFSGVKYSSSEGHMIMSGTSMATPHVSGAAALLLQLHPDWSPQDVKSALVIGASLLNESLWSAGAGGLWIPSSSDTGMLFSEPLISYQLAGDPQVGSDVLNEAGARTLTLGVDDWYSLSANGSDVVPEHLGVSTVSPSAFVLPEGGSRQVSLSVVPPGLTAEEGYYEGAVYLNDGSDSVRLPFGFAILTRLDVHVLDTQGREVVDPYGGVWVYDLPDADIAFSVRADSTPSPPASFLLPSGLYSVHAAGHELVYAYSDPYLLSTTVALDRLETRAVYLNMSDARELVLDLESEDGIPIYVKDYRVYLRHVGANNVSFHLVGTDYFVSTAELSSLPRARTVYVSDTAETVGISIAGFSYSAEMWDFVSRNWRHWYETVGSSSAGFFIESSADEQYLLAWEFEGISASTPSSLTVVDGQASVYQTRYDLPGHIVDPWCDWETRLPMGADSTFYVRRDTQSPINPLYSGMTRTVIVQGVFSELYFPGSLFGGYSEAEYYVPDYDHVLHAATASEIYLPDRNFVTPINGVTRDVRLGAGPYYPSLQTVNTNSTLVLIHPLLRDQSGAKVGGLSTPRLELLQNGMDYGVYQLSEYRARPDAMRIIDLNGGGAYVARISFESSPEISSTADIELGFSVPRSDVNPPTIYGLTMLQRFVPGDAIPVSVLAHDDKSTVSISIAWRSNSSTPWINLSVANDPPEQFTAVIQTSVSDVSLDLKVVARDGSGNYIQYVTTNAAKMEIPVLFDITALVAEVPFKNGNVSVILSGHLTDGAGAPLHPMAAVPLELIVGGTKVGMVLDENVSSSSHTHDGTIRFEWVLNPYRLFTAPDQDITVAVSFDLGIYQPVNRTISLRSIVYTNNPPAIQLLSPGNGSLIAPGTVIDLSITDAGAVTADYSLDGATRVPLSDPWDISTSSWSDGHHVLDVYAVDDDAAESRSSFEFEVDGSAPTLNITFPRAGSIVPIASVLEIAVTDSHLDEVRMQVDGGPWNSVAYPYLVDMSGWPIGTHIVDVQAEDLLGHMSMASVAFEIVNSTVAVNLLSPAAGSVVRSGTPIVLDVLGFGNISSVWSLDGAWDSLSPPYEIQSTGWADGIHLILVNATDELGGWCEISFAITIDDSPPSILLLSPQEGSFVTRADRVMIRVSDPNFASVSWEISGTTFTSVQREPIIFLDYVPSDGFFWIDITAEDVVGNIAEMPLLFRMDTSCPTITVDGLGSREEVIRGQLLRITASDVFLSALEWSLDGGAYQSAPSSATIDTGSLSLGNHDLRLIARDGSGKVAYRNVSLYVDGTPPSVTLSTSGAFEAGVPYEVRADISDDFAVASAVLRFELSSGGFSSIAMTQDGGMFRATVPSASLWDGMTVFVVAVDTVGHSTESPVLELMASTSPMEPGTDDGSEEGNALLRIFSDLGGLVVAALAAVAVAFLVALGFRRMRRSRDRPVPAARVLAPPIVSPPVSVAAQAEPAASHLPAVMANPHPANAGREGSGTESPSKAKGPTGPARENDVKPSLIDAIPEVVLKSPETDEAAIGEDIDYGALIERELIVGALRMSVYKDALRDIEKELSALDFEFIKDGPTIHRPKKMLD